MSRYGIDSSRKRTSDAHQPALGLALLAEKEHVVAGEQGEVDLGNDGVLVADDAGKELLAGLQHSQEVIANLLFDRLRYPTARPQILERGGPYASGHVPIVSACWKIIVAAKKRSLRLSSQR